MMNILPFGLKKLMAKKKEVKADTQGLYFEKDFYCKNWELKNERD